MQQAPPGTRLPLGRAAGHAPNREVTRRDSLLPHPGSRTVSGTTYLHPASDRDARIAAERDQAAEHDLEQAELFLLSLDAEMLTASGPRTAYLLGLAEGHLANLIERLREVAS
jgi:hypothetical protein